MNQLAHLVVRPASSNEEAVAAVMPIADAEEAWVSV